MDANIADRLARIAAELSAISHELGRSRLPLGPQAQRALDELRGLVAARDGAPVPHIEWVYHLYENCGFGRSRAYEIVRKLELRGHVDTNAAREYTLAQEGRTLDSLK